jgi:hypothetical protein
MRIAKQISYNQIALAKLPLEDIQYLTATGLPTQWAENDGSIQLYPVPDAAYTLTLYGVADLGVPVTTNEWTTEAYELILNEAKMILCRGPLRDPDGLALARDGRDEALAALRRETRSRAASGLTTDLPASCGGYNINTDC